MLQVENISKSFNGFMAVNKAFLFLKKRDIAAVIGPNGAGKTTLFNLITGQLYPDSGKILYKGKNIIGMKPHQICRAGISRSFQIVNIFNRLTVFENVQTAVLSYYKKTWNLFYPAKKLVVKETKKILENTGLINMAQILAGTLSHGDQKSLELAIALGNNPGLLILDEPTAGMSQEETSTVINLIKQMAKDFELTILFCEHDIEIVFSVATQIMVMRRGETIIQGTPEQVKKNRQVQEAYLG